MPHSAEISRANPSAFVFVIDQSGSMNDAASDGSGPKAAGVSKVINKLLQDLVIKCAKEEGVRDYYYVGVIGYGARTGPAFAGALAGRDLVSISEIANNPARVDTVNKKSDDGAGGILEQPVRMPVWFDPVSNNGTPMNQALGMAANTVDAFIKAHPGCFPPVVIHITDGESTDGDPSAAMQKITSLSSTDGNVLLFNLHLSSNPAAKTVSYPTSDANLPDEYAKTLFRGASALTDFMRTTAGEHGESAGEGARGFVLNAGLVEVIQALDIGTRPSNLR